MTDNSRTPGLGGDRQPTTILTGREPMFKVDERLLKVRDYAQELVRGGFKSREDIIWSVEDYASDVSPDLLELPLTEMIDGLLQAHYEEQKNWGETDCDRLDRAFAALEERGIVARQDFSCCGTCGHYEIWEEMTENSRGYTFYHRQDTESAAAGHGLYLSYGAKVEGDETEQAMIDIAWEIVAVLREHGLTVDWTGSTYRRIQIADLDWKRRRQVSPA
jgi:hypothetical protein